MSTATPSIRRREVAEVDADLRRLRERLADSIARTPSLTRRHIARYLVECDRLLDVRSALTARPGQSRP